MTDETKRKVFLNVEIDEQGSKASDFFSGFNEMYTEMKWQESLRTKEKLHALANYMSFWRTLIFWCTVMSNLLVARFYPFDQDSPGSYNLTMCMKLQFFGYSS